MIIGIDGNEANVNNRVGSNIYAFELIKWLNKIDEKNSYQIYLKEKPLDDFPKEGKRWQNRVIFPKKFSTQIGLPLQLYLRTPRPDIFFTPGHYAPRFSPVPTVISILDISYLLFPEYFKKSDLAQLTSWSKYSIKNAKRILTISEATKKDIVKFYGVDQDKIIVTYPGINLFSEDINREIVFKKYHLNKKYILYVGTLQPRKNIIRLIESYRKLDTNEINLVIVGKKGWLYDEIFQKVEEHSLVNKVTFLDYVTREELGVLYKNAQCLILPSLYEGFGIPVVEAMSQGIPVVVSNISSLPEIAGDAGILVDPYEIDSIVQGLKKAINLDQNERKSIIDKGLKRVKLFSWEKCAKETLKVLQEVYHESHH